MSEQEGQGSWNFVVHVLADDGRLTVHRVTLSWPDYNLWSSDGGDQPAKVLEAAISFLLSHMSDSALPERFDASLARRKFADADVIIPGLIAR